MCFCPGEDTTVTLRSQGAFTRVEALPCLCVCCCESLRCHRMLHMTQNCAWWWAGLLLIVHYAESCYPSTVKCKVCYAVCVVYANLDVLSLSWALFCCALLCCALLCSALLCCALHCWLRCFFAVLSWLVTASATDRSFKFTIAN